MRAASSDGFTLVELLISMSVLLLVTGGLFGFFIDNSRLNKAELMQAEVQLNARSCLSLVTQKLRSAGWDPALAGIDTVTLDPDTTDNVSQIEIFADLDMDGLTDGVMEQLTIRHTGRRVEWRTTNDTTQSFDTVASGISNDADGDGAPEPMFVPDSTSDPTEIVVTVTAESSAPDPRTGEPVRYTVSNTVTLRKQL